MRSIVLVGVLALAIGGCSKEQTPTSQNQPKTNSPGSSAGGGPPPEFKTSAAPVSLRVGTAGNLVFAVEPSPPWKINTDFPNRGELSDAGPLKVEGGAGDFEVSEKKLLFSLPVTATGPGESSAKGVVRFALCDPSRCIPLKEEVEWKVTSAE